MQSFICGGHSLVRGHELVDYPYILLKKGAYLYSNKLSILFYSNLLFFEFESHDLSYLDVNYRLYNFSILNNLFTRLKNI